MIRYTTILLLLMTAAACNKADDAVWTTKTESKKVEFHIHASQSYTLQQLNGIQAEVKLSVYKEELATHTTQLLWDTVITKRSLLQYPRLPQKIVIEKSFALLEGKEKLEAKYNTQFKTPGGVMQQTDSERSQGGDNFLFLDVGI